jgi:ferredoxin
MDPRYAEVAFENSEWGSAMTIAVPQASSLMDLCDAEGAPVPFSCRGASCSTCRIEVLEGRELLEEPNALEAELIHAREMEVGNGEDDHLL